MQAFFKPILTFFKLGAFNHFLAFVFVCVCVRVRVCVQAHLHNQGRPATHGSPLTLPLQDLNIHETLNAFMSSVIMDRKQSERAKERKREKVGGRVGNALKLKRKKKKGDQQYLQIRSILLCSCATKANGPADTPERTGNL